MPDRITLTTAEAEELYAYLRNQFLDVNKYPHLSALWGKISVTLRKQAQLIAAASK